MRKALSVVAILSFAAQVAAAVTFSPDPAKTKDLTLFYNFDSQWLNPGEFVDVEVPTSHKKMILDFIAITHRQDPRHERECYSQAERDCLPAYTSVEILDGNATDPNSAWRFWAGRGAGPHNSKFAEIRAGFGETDNLYEWQNKGHEGFDGSVSKSPIATMALRIRNVGRDSSIIERLVVKFMPPAPKEIVQTIFSYKIDLGAYDTAVGRKLPHSSTTVGYNQALVLSRGVVPQHKYLPADWGRGRGALAIPLLPGRTVYFVDIAVGDSVRGEPGGASISMEIQNNETSKDILMKRENVGSNGVMRATPSSIATKTQPGDVLVIRNHAGTAFVMGVRLGYGD